MEHLKWNWGSGDGAALGVTSALWDRLNFNVPRQVPPPPERPYSGDDRYTLGDVVIHPKYGRGNVVDRTDTTISVDIAGTLRRLAATNAEPARTSAPNRTK